MLFLIIKVGNNTFSAGGSNIYIAITGTYIIIYTALFIMLDFITKNNIINSFL